MNKREQIFREQLREAVSKVQSDCDQRTEFDRGVYAGASMVMVRLAEIQRRDEGMKADGIERGQP